jgi:hypothetical protein
MLRWNLSRDGLVSFTDLRTKRSVLRLVSSVLMLERPVIPISKGELDNT